MNNFSDINRLRHLAERKTMKRTVMMLLCLVIFTGSAMAQDSGYGLSLGYGQSKDNIDIYRVGLMKKWNVQWLENSTGYVDGYFELSYNHWDYSGKQINGIALSPVFVYAFNPSGNDWYPYIEGGVGVAYIDDYHIKDRDLSSNLQFEDRIGAGLRYNNFDLNFRYLHYSNAGFKDPNDGIDIWIGTLAWFF